MLLTGIVLVLKAELDVSHDLNLQVNKDDDKVSKIKITDMKMYCEPSKEALRVGLHPFLVKCQ